MEQFDTWRAYLADPTDGPKAEHHPQNNPHGETTVGPVGAITFLSLEYLLMQGDRVTGIPPAKARRTARACLQCRARKQRCSPEPDGPPAPCRRCKQQAITCSFQNARVVAFEEEPGPSRMAQLVVELHHQYAQHVHVAVPN